MYVHVVRRLAFIVRNSAVPRGSSKCVFNKSPTRHCSLRRSITEQKKKKNEMNKNPSVQNRIPTHTILFSPPPPEQYTAPGAFCLWKTVHSSEFLRVDTTTRRRSNSYRIHYGTELKDGLHCGTRVILFVKSHELTFHPT